MPASAQRMRCAVSLSSGMGLPGLEDPVRPAARGQPGPYKRSGTDAVYGATRRSSTAGVGSALSSYAFATGCFVLRAGSHYGIAVRQCVLRPEMVGPDEHERLQAYLQEQQKYNVDMQVRVTLSQKPAYAHRMNAPVLTWHTT
eukprot:1232750-Rhodomonas_salina.3